MENIAKLTSYGCYLDCDFETARYPDDKIHIVGLLAEYVYDLEQRILHYDERHAKLWHEIEVLRECVSKESDQDQKISDLETKLADLQQEQIAEMKEHQEVMKLADNTITNLVEDNRASQEWYKKQLAESEEQLKEEIEEKNGARRALSACNRQNDEFADMIKKLVSEKEELKQQLAEKETRIEELESQFAYECECNKQFVECQNENAQLKQQLEEYKQSLKKTIDNQIKQLKEMK